MTLIRQSDGSYRLARSRVPIAEIDIIAAAEEIFSHRLQRQGAIATPSDAMNYFRCRIGHLPHEEFHVLWLDSRHRILGCDRLFTGTLDGTAVHPREVVRRALEINAGAVVLAHNHPSGVCEPSASDHLITTELKDALKLIGVRVLDHLIVGTGSCVSLAERGALYSPFFAAANHRCRNSSSPQAALQASLRLEAAGKNRIDGAQIQEHAVSPFRMIDERVAIVLVAKHEFVAQAFAVGRRIVVVPGQNHTENDHVGRAGSIAAHRLDETEIVRQHHSR